MCIFFAVSLLVLQTAIRYRTLCATMTPIREWLCCCQFCLVSWHYSAVIAHHKYHNIHIITTRELIWSIHTPSPSYFQFHRHRSYRNDSVDLISGITNTCVLHCERHAYTHMTCHTLIRIVVSRLDDASTDIIWLNKYTPLPLSRSSAGTRCPMTSTTEWWKLFALQLRTMSAGADELDALTILNKIADAFAYT